MNHLLVESVNVRIQNQPILQDVSFSARSGEFIGLIGPNGSGKSTLLRTLGGLQQLSGGNVILNGRQVAAYTPQELARLVGYVPQDTALGFDFLVEEVVRMGRHAYIPRFSLEKQRDREVVVSAMERTSIIHLAHNMMTSLSGGQRQMVFIAKALTQEPGILLFDEPISALDIHRQLQVLELIRELADEGALAIAALHDLNLAARYCDRLMLLKDGKVLTAGSAEDVLKTDILQVCYDILPVVRTDQMIDAKMITALRCEHQREAEGNERGQSVHVHVLGGAGQANELLAMLYRNGIQTSVGPLEAHDPDAMLAQQLGMNVLTYPSFTEMDEDVLKKSRTIMDQADCIVAAPVPIGKQNLALKDLLRGRHVLGLSCKRPGDRQSLTDLMTQRTLSATEIVTHILDYAVLNHRKELESLQMGGIRR